ncbi:TIGR04104 family putative zinc finger protein [Pseudoneobacillus sp. C159]
MGIQKCDNCGYQFTWMEIQKVSRVNYKPLVCCKCGTKHNVSIQTRLTLGLSTGIMVAISLFYLNNVSFGLGILFVILFSLAVIILFPYFARFKAYKNQ